MVQDIHCCGGSAVESSHELFPRSPDLGGEHTQGVWSACFSVLTQQRNSFRLPTEILFAYMEFVFMRWSLAMVFYIVHNLCKCIDCECNFALSGTSSVLFCFLLVTRIVLMFFILILLFLVIAKANNLPLSNFQSLELCWSVESRTRQCFFMDNWVSDKSTFHSA